MKYSIRKSVAESRTDLIPFSVRVKVEITLTGEKDQEFLLFGGADVLADKWNRDKRTVASRIKTNFSMSLKLDLNRCRGWTIFMRFFL